MNKGSQKGFIFRRTTGPIGSPVAYFVTGILCVSAFLTTLRSLRQIPGVCIFRRLTGVPCPGCGLTRSVVATAHLDIATALSFHVFGPLFFVICLTVFGLATAQRFFSVDIPWKSIEKWSKWPIIFLSVAWLAWAAHRAFLVAIR